MNKTTIMLACSMCFTHASEKWIQQEKYTIEYDADGHKKPPITFCFKQQCDIDNTQNVSCNHPLVQPAPQESAQAPSVTWLPSWVPFSDMITPFKVGTSGLLLIIFYYFKTKLTLYSLGKSCVETAFWSLWNLRKQTDIEQEQSQDTALLYDILHTYNTDQHAVAMSHFLHDVDNEIAILRTYIEQTSQSTSGFIRFLLPDMSKDITEAEARLTKLMYLKQKVLFWLAHQKMERAQHLWG